MNRASTAAATTLARVLTGRSDLLLAGLVVATVGLMIVPLPTAALDALLSVNLGLAVLLLASSVYVSGVTSVTTLPSVLLLATLFRLALNVSSTRLILVQADAGAVIDAFGSYVVAGNYVVGAVVFSILTVIQFVVIAKGAERMSEVAARFSLDAMPGRQMAIDSDLRAGSITVAEAGRRREDLQRESQLYGAMDGAMKFVKGDAIAGLVIIGINIVGGLIIGVWQHGMSLADAARTYTLLTVGDGLVTQIPALIIATAAAVIVTRVAGRGESHLGAEIAQQVLARPRALGIAGALFVLLALVPGLPAAPFVLIGALLLAAGLVGARAGAAEPAAEPRGERLEVRVDAGLVASHGDECVVAALEGAVSAVSRETGVPLPPPRLDAASVSGVQIMARGVPIAIPLSDRATPQELGAAVQSGLRTSVSEFLGLQRVKQILERVRSTHPATVDAALSRRSTREVSLVLSTLAADGIPLGSLDLVLETLADEVDGDATDLAERARKSLVRQITHQYAPKGELPALLFDREVEDSFAAAVKKAGPTATLPRDIVGEVRNALETSVDGLEEPIVALTRPDLRRAVASFVTATLGRGRVVVLSVGELGTNVRITPAGLVSVRRP